jgi:hypothetical protein
VPILLIFLFGIITFGAVLALKSSMTQAAEEGARAAVGVPYLIAPANPGCPGSPPSPGCFSAAGSAAVAKANSSLSWTGRPCNGGNGMTCTATFDTCKDVNGLSTGFYCVTVTVTYDYPNYPYLPPVPFLNYALPTLTTTAVVQLNAE